jgi:hypothetical protein
MGPLARADSAEELRADLTAKYPSLTKEIGVYLSLFLTDDARAFERDIGELAIRAATVGDYSEIYKSQRHGRENVQRAYNLLGDQGGWSAYWQEMGRTTRRVLLQNPASFLCFLDILQSMDQRSDSSAVKAAVREQPALLVIIYRLPAVAGMSQENRRKLLPFLLRVDYGGSEDMLNRLNALIQERSQSLIQLLESPTGGYTAAITFWAVPEVFDDRDRLLGTWVATAAQAKFVKTLRASCSPAEWPDRAAKLREALHTKTVDLPTADVLLLLALNPGGELLQELYRVQEEKNNNKADFQLLTDFLAFCLDRELPLLPSQVLKATTDPLERRAMMEAATDRRFIGPEQRANKKLIPLGALAVVQFSGDTQFRKFLVKYRAELILYLYKDGTPNEALRNAVRFDFKDVAWNESWYRSAMARLPAGEMLNVCIKSWNDYPIERREWIAAAIDAADMVGSVATGGLSQTASLSISAVKTALKRTVGDSWMDSVERRDRRRGQDGSKVESDKVRDSESDAVPGNSELQFQRGLLQRMTAEQFGVPYRQLSEQTCRLNLSRKPVLYAIPKDPAELADAIRSNDSDILFVPLSQYQEYHDSRKGTDADSAH